MQNNKINFYSYSMIKTGSYILALMMAIFAIISCEPAEQDIQTSGASQKLNNNLSYAASQDKKPARNFGIMHDDMVLGNMEATTVVVEYYSPTCFHCAEYHKAIFPKIAKSFIDNGKIAYVIREFIGNKQDLDAAILARCEGSLEKYKPFMKIILEQQSSWAFSKNYQEILTNIGILGGINPAQYAHCINNDAKVQTLIDNTQLLAQTPSFIGTPTFFINGVHYEQPYTFKDLSQAIEQAINMKSKEIEK